jgi:hypothetical protein
MKVVLYDEGSYPSGSACGRVAAENPDFAAHALVRVEREITGPHRGYWRPSVSRALVNQLVCVVLARCENGRVNPESARLLPIKDGLVRIEVGAGAWKIVACFDVPSGGVIRGVFPEQEDATALAPAAGDLMNPAAVAAFIRLTHDAYAQAIGEHLGSTVIAMFTDEPSPLGRGARREARPYTPGFESGLAQQWGWHEDKVLTWLPALWADYGSETEAFRRAYARAVHDRIVDVFYRAQSEWCERHGIVLTGHPAASNDMASLSLFHAPGQDMVWRWVVPGDDSGLVGANSVAPKAATSAARARGRQRIATELFGAYGWCLSLDEAKWLLDWHLARGNNLIFPHALFYSVLDGRAFESEPDVGIHNVFWRHFQHLARYARRMSWMLTDVEHVCEIAVLGQGDALPWGAARVLYENQMDFLYVDDVCLSQANVTSDGLHVGTQAYRVVIVDGAVDLSESSQQALNQLAQQGGTVLDAEPLDTLVQRVRTSLPPDVRIQPPAPSLRTLHLRKSGLEIFALFNEGEERIETNLSAQPTGKAEWWDLLRGAREPMSREENGTLRLTLERRESRLLVIDSTRTPELVRDNPQQVEASMRFDLDGTWTVTDENHHPMPAPVLGDWASVRALERFSGTLIYRTSVTLTDAPRAVVIHLGSVGESATVRVNGTDVGFALWSPHRVRTDGSAWRVGENQLEVHVTNSAANFYEGALRPSGLMGPVWLEVLSDG